MDCKRLLAESVQRKRQKRIQRYFLGILSEGCLQIARFLIKSSDEADDCLLLRRLTVLFVVEMVLGKVLVNPDFGNSLLIDAYHAIRYAEQPELPKELSEGD